jgi:predicted Zn-dependent protease
MKKYNETMKDLAAVLLMDPNSVPPRALLGRALKMMAELQKAEEQLSHTVNLEPDQPSHYVELGDVKFRMNKRHKIVEAIHGTFPWSYTLTH